MIKSKRSWLKFKILKWCLTGLGFVLSAYFSYDYFQNQNQRFNNNLNLKAERAILRIEARLKIYETLITQTQAFFITLEEVNYRNFYKYYDSLKDLSRFQGIRGLGFTRYIPQEELKNFLQEIRKEIPNFEIWPFEDKEEYFPLVYLGPQSVQGQTIGFDQSSETQRRIAFNTAIASGDTTMTSRINFVRERNHTLPDPGFLLIRPVFKEDQSPSLKENLIGFIFAPFLYKDFFKAGWEDFEDIFYFQVYDLHHSQEDNLIYSSIRPLVESPKIEKVIHLFDQNFRIYFYPKAKNKNLIETSLLILTLGFSFTLLISKFLNDTIKRAEQSSLNESYLEESLKARDEFISIASHELKTPLTSLKLRAQLSKRKLQRQRATEKDIIDFSTEIEKQVDRLERLVNDILDISRIRTGNFSLQPDHFDLCHLMEELISRMAPQFASPDQVQFITQSPEVEVFWDKLRIEQIMTNLLTNALKYGQSTPVTVEVQEKKGDILISVQDRGIGIDPKFRETIFNRFERAGISPNEISGLGLGLYIAYKIVTAHQGKIWVESELAQGSTFFIKMPKYPSF